MVVAYYVRESDILSAYTLYAQSCIELSNVIQRFKYKYTGNTVKINMYTVQYAVRYRYQRAQLYFTVNCT